MARPRSTHDVEVGPAVVVKRFRSWSLDQHRREWRALTLLAEYAPGLAPAPVRADLAGEPPSVVMSRLDGAPLSAPMAAGWLGALAESLATAQRAIPPEVLRGLPFRLVHPRDLLGRLRTGCARRPPVGAGPLVAEAFGEVTGWVARPRLIECRRLLALFWFQRLLAEDPARPHALVRQAGRLLALLGG